MFNFLSATLSLFLVFYTNLTFSADSSKVIYQGENLIFSLPTTLSLKQDTNVRGPVILQDPDQEKSFTIEAYNFIDIDQEKYELKENLLSQQGVSFQYYENNSEKLFVQAGGDVQSACAYPEKNLSLFLVVYEGKKSDYPILEVCESIEIL